jgi:hypothetical protein
VLNVGFFEGPAHEEKAIHKERFRKIGVVAIKGIDLERTMPVGPDVEITIRIEASHEALARVYLPSLGRAFEGNLLEFGTEAAPTADELEFRLDQLDKRLGELEAASVTVQPLRSRVVDARQEIHAARSGGADSHARAVTILERIEIDADSAEEREAPRLALEELEEYLAFCEDVVNSYGEDAHIRRLDQLKRNAEQARLRQEPEEARSIRGRLLDLAAQLYWEQPGAWVGRFQELAVLDDFEQPEQARGLIERGRQALDLGDLDMLKRVVLDLLSMRPQTGESGPWSIFGGIARAR